MDFVYLWQPDSINLNPHNRSYDNSTRRRRIKAGVHLGGSSQTPLKIHSPSFNITRAHTHSVVVNYIHPISHLCAVAFTHPTTSTFISTIHHRRLPRFWQNRARKKKQKNHFSKLVTYLGIFVFKHRQATDVTIEIMFERPHSSNTITRPGPRITPSSTVYKEKHSRLESWYIFKSSSCHGWQRP